MSIRVCKFGGSSVADAAMFAKVRRIISECPSRRYIVLSAPGKRSSGDEKITDLLIRAHLDSCRADYSILAQIFDRYASIRRALAPGFRLEEEFLQIRRRLHTSLDYAASRGEYLCAKLFCAYSGLNFVDAEELLFFRSDGGIDFHKSRAAVQEKLLCHERAVIPGFYGSDASGHIRTFSRGGSDVSGALIAALADAELYENWTDVDGLYTADPCIVENPRRSPAVSLAQMEQICAAGAKLLHPDALSPLKGRSIDVMLKNTFAPGAEGTRISESCRENVRCVTGRRSLYMLSSGADAPGCPVLYQLPAENSLPVSAVSAFGLSDAQLKRVRRQLKPSHIINRQDHIDLIIPRQEYETVIRRVHAI